MLNVYLFVVFATVLIWIFFKNNKRPPNMPPGLTGLPLIGSFPSASVPFYDQVESNRKKFGDVFLWRIGSRDIVFICDPKIIRKTLSNPLFLNRPEEHFTFDLGTNFKKIGISNGNTLAWQSHRRFALHHLRDAGLGKSAVEAVVQLEAEALVDDLKRNFADKPTKIPISVNVATLNVILNLTTGMRFEREDPRTSSVLHAISSIVKEGQGLLNLFDVFPGLVKITPRFVMNMIGLKNTLNNINILQGFLKDLMAKKRKTLDKNNPDGFIESYLARIENKEDPELFNDEGLIATMGDLLIAGSDTTAIQTEWLIHHVACRPDVHAKIQAEIDNNIPRDRLPSLTDKPNLPYTEATINEGLRILSLATFGLFRTASEDTQIEGFCVPKGSIILPYLFGSHKDPAYWSKPNEFNPDHFLDENGKFTSKNEAFLPFSCGRRACLGESLARTELFVYLVSLLQNFNISVPDRSKKKVEISPDVIVFRFPADNEVIFTER